MKKISYMSLALASVALVGCSDDNINNITNLDNDPASNMPEEYYAGGKLGTTTIVDAHAYKQPTPAVDEAGMGADFQIGEGFFERDFNTNTSNSAYMGLGPVYVRRGCLYCHPAYGHGKKQNRYRASDQGNGYLLVIYDKQTNNYIYSVAGMPQTAAVAPFKAQIDETKIVIDWKNYTDEWSNTFPDGETYELKYPEVTIPADAYYSPVTVMRNGEKVVIPSDQVASEIGVRLESTIGIYGTGLIDAIPEDAITEQWKKENDYNLNPAMWDKEANDWKNKYSTGLDKKSYVRRFTYALSRGPLLDGPGANAIWNITNVTRPKRTYHYLSLDPSIYATTSSEDPDVQAGFEAYINKVDPNKTHTAWHEGEMKDRIYSYLTAKDLDEEMTAESYKQFMIWHRGLAVPAARNVTTEKFKQGKQLFSQIGCTACHRPSWTTGEDNIQDPNGVLTNDDMPRYPNQKIWPYTDLVQHRLFMKNDIRTGWCRTTPLWGRGLSKLCTGAEYRLHDCRAENTLQAIMWHGNAQSDARWTIMKFRQLTKEQRDAIIYFIDSI